MVIFFFFYLPVRVRTQTGVKIIRDIGKKDSQGVKKCFKIVISKRSYQIYQIAVHVYAAVTAQKRILKAVFNLKIWIPQNVGHKNAM